MRIFDLDKWTETLETLLRNKSRSLLTAFGIFWGIFMLVLLMGGGRGFKALMSANFSGMAQNSCFIAANTTTRAHKGLQSGRTWHLNRNDAETLKREIDGIDICEPVLMEWGKSMRYKSHSSSGSITGVFPAYAEVENPHLCYGRFINQTDCDLRRKVCVIGRKTYEDLFPDGGNPCGCYIAVDSIYYEVVGVTDMTSNINIGGNSQTKTWLPYTTTQQLYQYGDETDMLALTAKAGRTVSSITGSTEAVIKREHLIAPDDNQAVFLFNMEQMYQMVDSLFRGINLLIWIIGIGTLLSGAIGVSNIMMVTVRERTAEIGIRRAIGARPASIMRQIMAESIVLTILAGLSGIMFAVIILQIFEMALGATAAKGQFQISFTMALGAAAVLTILGVLAGLAPSFRALAIKPIDAIRDE